MEKIEMVDMDRDRYIDNNEDIVKQSERGSCRD